MMVQSLTEPHADAAYAAVRADRSSIASPGTFHPTQSSRRTELTRHGLDWSGFRDLYYPASRRHDLEAIVAYGAYQRTSPPPAASEPSRLCEGWCDLSRSVVSRTGRTKAAGRANATRLSLELLCDATRRVPIAAMVDERVGCL